LTIFLIKLRVSLSYLQISLTKNQQFSHVVELLCSIHFRLGLHSTP